VDIAAEQIVRWLLTEQRAGRLRLEIRATQSYVSRPLDQSENIGLGEDESSDLDEVVAIGVVEVSPPAPNNGWLLRIRMEDPLGPRLPEDEPAPEGEEEIDLETFKAEFVAPGRATEDVSLITETPEAAMHFKSLFDALLRDRHLADDGGRL
jgi:hypothetical protein